MPLPANRIRKPAPGEYPAYAEMYMKLIPDQADPLTLLEKNAALVRTLVSSLSAAQLHHRYAPGKWSIKEILVHLVDDERIYSYRALRYARNDDTPLPGFDQDHYTKFAMADERTVDSILEEYTAVRQATLALFRFLPEDAFDRRGEGTGSFYGATVRALLFHIAGHEMHHLNIIRELYL